MQLFVMCLVSESNVVMGESNVVMGESNVVMGESNVVMGESIDKTIQVSMVDDKGDAPSSLASLHFLLEESLI